MNNSFWSAFYDKPLNEIPWQNTQADWFKELVDQGEIRGSSALDLGCGTGMKSIYLAQHGFQMVVGVDIAPRAIEIARDNAGKKDLLDKCKFISGDIGEWSFLDEKEKFDFVLDWATLHCISPEQRITYAHNIKKHTHRDSLLLIRCFSTDTNKNHFEEEVGGLKSNIYFLSLPEIEDLFPEFEIIKQNKSLPRTKDGYFFVEVLMKKK